MAALARPDTLLQQLKPAAGPYMNGNDTSIAGDEMKTRYTLEILRRYKPALHDAAPELARRITA